MPIKFLNDVAVDTSVLYVDTVNDRVGIGTASPSQKLDVNGNIELAQYGYIYFGSNTSDQLTINNSLSGSQIIQRGSSYLELQSFNGSGIKFNVGGFLGTDVMVVTSSANVGIGTTSPSQKLHVVGNTKIEGVVIVDSGNSSLYIGSSTTGQSSTSTGDRNVVIGPSAFRSNTSAKYNTAVGHAAMQDTTTGNYNSVLGNQALRDNIDGDFNVAVGNQTMAFTTNSSNNTAVGYRALYQAQSGSNTAIGQGAFNSLQSSTSSGGNTGIGQEVLNKITSGRRNVGVGHAAGQKYGGGNNNVVTANDSVLPPGFTDEWNALVNSDDLNLDRLHEMLDVMSTAFEDVDLSQAEELSPEDEWFNNLDEAEVDAQLDGPPRHRHGRGRQFVCDSLGSRWLFRRWTPAGLGVPHDPDDRGPPRPHGALVGAPLGLGSA